MKRLFGKILTLSIAAEMAVMSAHAYEFEDFCKHVLDGTAEAFSHLYAQIRTGPFLVDPWNADYLYRVMYEVANGKTFNKSLYSNRGGNISVQAALRNEVFQVTTQVSHRALEDNAQLIFWDFIRKGGLTALPPNMKGIVFQTQTDDGIPTVYFFVNLAHGEFSSDVPVAYRNIVKDYRSQVFDVYKNRLGLDDASLARLNQASEITNDRTMMMIKTHHPIVNYKKLDASGFSLGVSPGQILNDNSSFYAQLPERFEIESGVSLVYSDGPDQPFPFELVSDMRVPRAAGVRSAEPGRLIIKKKRVVEATVSDWAQISAMFMGSASGPLFIQADNVHARVFSAMQFKPTGVTGEYAGSPYQILSVPAQEFMKHHAMAVFESGAFNASSAWMTQAWGTLQALFPNIRVPSQQERIRQLDRELRKGMD